jgi:hypothetical protein
MYGSFDKVPSILISKKANSLWERTHPLGSLSDLLIFEDPLKNVDGITKALNKITAPNEVISMVYYTIVNEAVIYYHPNRWRDRKFHKNIAKEFNKLRTAFLSMYNVVYSLKIINFEIINHELKLTKDGADDYMISCWGK